MVTSTLDHLQPWGAGITSDTVNSKSYVNRSEKQIFVFSWCQCPEDSLRSRLDVLM